ncbi:hypothetical protein CD107_12555, partial [Mammaliicoccus vitulinus]
RIYCKHIIKIIEIVFCIKEEKMEKLYMKVLNFLVIISFLFCINGLFIQNHNLNTTINVLLLILIIITFVITLIYAKYKQNS